MVLRFYLPGTTGSPSETVPENAIHGGIGTLGGTECGFAVWDTTTFVVDLLVVGLVAVTMRL